MTKEEYTKNANNLSYILYEYYKEKFDEHKHKPMLTQDQLFTFLPMWGDMGGIMRMVVKYYADKFK
jgi:hypothetical protein